MRDNLTGTDKKMLAYLQKDIGKQVWEQPVVRPLKISTARFNGNERVMNMLIQWLNRNYGLQIIIHRDKGCLSCY